MSSQATDTLTTAPSKSEWAHYRVGVVRDSENRKLLPC